MQEGKIVSELIVVVAGEIRTSFKNGQVESLSMGPGSLVGEMEYLHPSPSAASVVAVVDTQVLSFRHEDLRRLPEERPALALRLQRGLLWTLAEKHKLVTDSLVKWKMGAANVASVPRHLPSQSRKTHRHGLDTTTGESPAMRHLCNMVARVKHHAGNVLIFGDPGAGKELVAKALNQAHGDGKERPFIAIDSATLSMSTVESILFGHRKGSFTGADRAHAGLFEQANGGTVYFDEIGNMPLDVQAKLLRVIQEQEVRPIGASQPKRLSFRVIAATNRNLQEACERKEFRYDLYSRLAVFELTVPPLRDRRDDVQSHVEHFLDRFSPPQVVYAVSPAALDAILTYDMTGLGTCASYKTPYNMPWP